MTEKAREFLEKVSKDKKLSDKLKKAEKEEFFRIAAEMGYPLTEEDLKPSGEEKLSDDEVINVPGGRACACILGGGGEGTHPEQELCYCAFYGDGYYWDLEQNKLPRCMCPLAGGGTDSWYGDKDAILKGDE